MPWRTRQWSILALSVLSLLTQGAGPLFAQAPNLGPLASPTGLGSLALSPGQLMGTPGSQKSMDDSISITDSYVSFIDAATPRNTIMLRFEGGYNNPQPTRAEYILSKGGLPNSPGMPLIESKIDYQELTSYAEIAWTP